MHPYFLLAGILVSLSGVLIIFYILAFRYYFLEKERNQLVTLVFHQIYELLTSVRWHTELLRSSDLGKIPTSKLQTLAQIDAAIDLILKKHAEYFPQFKNLEESQQIQKNMSLMGKMLKQTQIPLVLHEVLDLITGIKWQTELLAGETKTSKSEVVQQKIFQKIDGGIDELISLMDRFLRVSGRQRQLNDKSAEKIVSSGQSEVFTSEQKDMLKLKKR